MAMQSRVGVDHALVTVATRTRERRGGDPIDYLERQSPPKLASIVRHIIDHARGVDPQIEPVSIDDNEWLELWNVLLRHRIGPLLSLPIATGSVVVPAGARAVVAAQARVVAALQMRLEFDAGVIIGLLDANDIDTRVLKGLATSELDYTLPGLRHTCDIDLVCRAEDFLRACEVLRFHGYRELTPRWQRQPFLMKGATFRTPSGAEVDLHHRLFRIGDPETSALFQPGEPLRCGGMALAVELRLAHARCHLMVATPHFRRLSSLVDVAILTDKVPTGSQYTFAEFAELEGVAAWLGAEVGLDSGVGKPRCRPSLVNLTYQSMVYRRGLEWLAVARYNRRHWSLIEYLRFWQWARRQRRWPPA